MTEAEFLAHLRTLPLHAGAHGLTDDTATLAPYILTTDTLVEGVHFLAGDPPGDVAWKLIATNLSDLAAKGAVPVGVLLNYPLRATPPFSSPAEAGARPGNDHDEAQPDVPSTSATGPRLAPGKREREDWDTAFLAGLAAALAHFDTAILGGDTVSLPPHAPRVLTLTAIGEDAAAPPRSGARAGDALYVTGTIGDAGAGLSIAQGADGPPELLAAYRRPQPRLTEGRALAPLVHAMMDVSDGLLIDAARMAAACDLAVTIDLAAIPISPAWRDFAGDTRDTRLAAATAGDDYQLLFAAPQDFAAPVACTRVGRFTPGAGVTLTDGGEPLPLPARLGFQHGAGLRSAPPTI